MEIILSLVLLIIDVFSGKLFLDCFFIKKSSLSKFKESVLIVAINVLYCIGMFFLNDYFNLKILFMIIVGIFIWNQYYQGTIIKKGLMHILYTALELLVEYFTIILIGKIIPNATFLLENSALFGYTVTFLIRLIIFIVIFIIRIVKNQYDVEKINKNGWICISVFALFTIISIMAMVSNWEMAENQMQANVLVCILAGFVVMNIILFYLINQIILIEKAEKDNAIFKERMQKEIETYKTNWNNRAEIEELTHEFNNILTILKSNDYEDEELKNITDNTIKRFNENANTINTKNSTANMVLNAKIREMRKKNIGITLEMDDLSMLKLEEEDIFIILSNLINNAIEACEKCDKKTISIKLVYDAPYFIISVKNSIKEKPMVRDGKYITSKKENSEMHGIGITNIIKVVIKYKGDWNINYTDTDFVFTIMINMSTQC